MPEPTMPPWQELHAVCKDLEPDVVFTIGEVERDVYNELCAMKAVRWLLSKGCSLYRHPSGCSQLFGPDRICIGDTPELDRALFNGCRAMLIADGKIVEHQSPPPAK